jgi:hypothetical protein
VGTGTVESMGMAFSIKVGEATGAGVLDCGRTCNGPQAGKKRMIKGQKRKKRGKLKDIVDILNYLFDE